MKRTLILSSIVALALSACGASTTTVRIGVILPITGDAASLGIDQLNGIKMAVDEVNAKGGVQGKQVELVVEDGRCNGSDAASAAQKLVNVDKVTAIIGGLCSSETLAIAPIAEAGKVVVLSPGSSSPDVTKAGTYIFRNYPSDALKTVATAKVIAEKGYKKVAMISENTDFCQGVIKGMHKDVGDSAIAFDETVEPGMKDFRSLLEKMKKTEFDVFYPNTNGDASMASLVQQYRDAGFKQPILSHEVADSATLGEIAKKASEGLQLVTVKTSGEGTTFEKDFLAKFGKVQSSIAFAAHSYDAAGLILQTITSVGTDGTAIRDALVALKSYSGVIGDIHFDQNGDVVGVPFVLKEFKDGKTFTVKPIPLE